MFSRYCRTVLCTPATAPERFASCHGSGADICLVDLEDAVAPSRKEEARRSAVRFFTAARGLPVRCAVRINPVVEPDGVRDLLALRDFPVPPEVVLVPKVESPRDLEIVAGVLGGPTALFAVIETPLGVQRLPEIAAAGHGLCALIFGSADYAAALGIGPAWDPLAHARSVLVNSARAHDLHAIDSPTFDLADRALLRRESLLAKQLGFSGKIALHPEQLPVITEAFTPTAAELAHATRVVEAALRSGDGVTTVDGGMVGKPFFEAAQRLLAEFGPLTHTGSVTRTP
ncbi:HpcH/HpaI aldolase/citrate lyase family protein [Saccharothrix lopnurensis]|uniref:HpcH/HpaI aldolase/citrate lyase family protein n=1 Tax=Saccharothrix lopnurensis TaxID=1670621 RepID=A0ABW1PBI6_9PSEU